MKTVIDTPAGAQILLGIPYKLQDSFEEYLTEGVGTVGIRYNRGISPQDKNNDPRCKCAPNGITHPNPDFVRGFEKVSILLLSAVVCLAILKIPQ